MRGPSSISQRYLIYSNACVVSMIPAVPPKTCSTQLLDRLAPMTKPRLWYDVRVDPRGRVCEVSQFFRAQLGYDSFDRILGKHIVEFLSVEVPCTHTARRTLKPNGDRAELPIGSFCRTFRRANGQTTPVDIDYVIVPWEGEPAILYIIASDVQSIWTSVVDKLNLTDREFQATYGLCEGLTNTALAERLNLAPAIVRTHLRNIFSKSGMQSRVQLVSTVLKLLSDEMALAKEKNGGKE